MSAETCLRMQMQPNCDRSEVLCPQLHVRDGASSDHCLSSSVVYLNPVLVYVSADCSAPMHALCFNATPEVPDVDTPATQLQQMLKWILHAQEVTSSCVTATQGDWSVGASMAAVRSALQSSLASHLGLAPPRLVLLLQVALPAWQLKSQAVQCLASAAGLSGFQAA